jgi:hypothetical protein
MSIQYRVTSSGKQLEIGMQWETAANAVVRNDTTNAPTQIDTFTNSALGSPDYGSTANAVTGQWKRYSISGARPATATQCPCSDRPGRYRFWYGRSQTVDGNRRTV